MFEIFAKSVKGESHRKNNDKPCEDYSGVFKNEVLCGNIPYKIVLAVVADGHGGDKYFRSRFGSKLAVETAHELIDGFIKATAEKGIGFFDATAKTNQEKTVENLVKLEHNIIRVWREKVLEHIKQNSWTGDELAFCKKKGIVIDEKSEDVLLHIYGTTLIAVLVTEKFWFALHIGDGACVVIHQDGRAEIAVPEDKTQGLGATHSLSEIDAKDHFRHNFGFEILLGATVATDGVADSYPKDKYLNLNVTDLLAYFVEQPDQAKKELAESFLPMVSKEGSEDDVSLACIFNVEAARPILASVVDKANLELEVSIAKKNIEQLKKEITAIKLERDDWQKKYDGKEQALNHEKEDHSKTKATVQTLTKEKTELLTKLASKDVEKKTRQIEATIKKDLDDERRDNQKLKKDLEKANRKIESLEQKIEDEKKGTNLADVSTNTNNEQSDSYAEYIIIDPKSIIKTDDKAAKESVQLDYNNDHRSGDEYFRRGEYVSAKKYYELAKNDYHSCKNDNMEIFVVARIELCNQKIGGVITLTQNDSGTADKSEQG